jgi:hypothetical protein
MSKRKDSGEEAENAVIELTKCPNCNRKLQKLPTNTPLVDVRCEFCQFRAQVKSHKGNPDGKISVQGGGWEVLNKTHKAGYAISPIIVVFKGENEPEIRFYPFILPRNLGNPYELGKTHRQAGYKMFNYVGLDTLPYFIWHNGRYVKGT